jgi:Transposase zinc-binding domain
LKAAYEVADALNKHWLQVEHLPQINSWQLRTLGAVKRCRTSAMGGHVDACTNCGTVRISYNSCRNRHCPKCQCNERERWIQKREEELLPVPYFHIVFTLPDTLNQLAMHKPKQVYDSLF